jgi:hypothetical protein
MIDRLTERQNQGNLVTQSYGPKVGILLTKVARLPKSIFRDDSNIVPVFLSPLPDKFLNLLPFFAIIFP